MSRQNEAIRQFIVNLYQPKLIIFELRLSFEELKKSANVQHFETMTYILESGSVSWRSAKHFYKNILSITVYLPIVSSQPLTLTSIIVGTAPRLFKTKKLNSVTAGLLTFVVSGFRPEGTYFRNYLSNRE